MSSPRRVLFWVPPESEAEVVEIASETAAALGELGLHVEVASDPIVWSARDADLVHVFGWSRPDRVLPQLERFRSRGTPIVWQPAYATAGDRDYATHAGRALVQNTLSEHHYQFVLRELARRRLMLFGSSYDAIRHDQGRSELLDRMTALADHLCVGSSREAVALLQTTGRTSLPFTVAPPGVRPVAALDPHRAADDGFPERFVLSIGPVEPRRNQLLLIEALRGSGISLLVLGGSADPGYLRHCHERAGQLLQYVPDPTEGQVVAALRTTLAYVACLPDGGCDPWSLKAAAAGCPVVVSNASAELERFQGLAYYCDPLDSVSIGLAVTSAWRNRATDAQRWQQLERLARDWTWRRTAEITTDVYRQVLDRKGLRHQLDARARAGIADARRVACLARFDELDADPTLLAAWAGHFSGADPLTLVVYACGVPAERVESAILRQLTDLNQTGPNDIDVLAIAVPHANDEMIARGIDCVFSSHGGTTAHLADHPHFGPNQLHELRRHFALTKGHSA